MLNLVEFIVGAGAFVLIAVFGMASILDKGINDSPEKRH